MNPEQIAAVPEEWRECVYDPPTTIYGHDLVPFKKYILLVAGDLVAAKVVVDVGPPVNIPNPMSAFYEVLPADKVPAGKTPVIRYDPNPVMAQAWAALITNYTSTAFKNDAWELTAIRATSSDSINAALAELQKARPLALVVHYFNHGGSDVGGGYFTRGAVHPFLAIRTEGYEKLQLPDPAGVPRTYDLLVPTPDRVSRYYTDDLARKIQADFPAIPLLLILDGCELGPSLDYATNRLPIVVSVDRALCGSNLGLFSVLFSGPVTPDDFDKPRATLPKTLRIVNTALTKHKVTYVENRHWSWFTKAFLGSSTTPEQRASMTKWYWP